MAINKKLIHFKNYSDFNSKKLSANETNTAYRLGVNGTVTGGEPDILYQSICWIKDVKKMWTHDTLYDCSGENGLSEEDIIAMGFTKNTGTYSKPSGGIPKADLESDVQSVLDHAINAVVKDNIGGWEAIQIQGFNGSTNDMLYALPDEANGQEDDILLSQNTVKTINGESIFGKGDITTSNGTITEVKANGTSVATSGVANIPAASTSKYGVTKLSSSTSSTSTSLAATASAVKSAYDLANGKQEALVSGTNIKTINNNSILGSGNLTINPLLSITSDSTNASRTITISPNVFYNLTAAQTTQKTFDISNSGVVNNSDNVWGIRFQIGTTIPTINFSSTNYRIIWANGVAPTFESGVIYEITFKLLGTSLLAVCGAFKQA